MSNLRVFRLGVVCLIATLVGTLFAAKPDIAGTATARRALRFALEKKLGRKIEEPQPTTEQTRRPKEPTTAAEQTPAVTKTHAVSTAPAAPTQQTAGDKLLTLIPADALFCVRINNFDQTLQHTDQYLAGASPVPMGISMMARMQLAGLLGDANLTGIDTSASFAIFGLAGSSGVEQPPEVFIAGLLPVTDYSDFLNGNPNSTAPDERGVSKIISTGMDGSTRTMLVTGLADYALLTTGDNYDALVETADSLAGAGEQSVAAAVNSAQASEAINSPAWARANVRQLAKNFGTLITQQIEQARAATAGMEQPPGASIGPSPAETIEIYAGLLDALLTQADSVCLNLDPKPQVCTATLSLSALPGTELAQLFTGPDRREQNQLTGYLRRDAVVNCIMAVDTPFWKKLNEAAMDLSLKMMGASLEQAKMREIKQIVEQMASITGNSAAFSFFAEQGSPPFGGTYACAVKNPEQYIQLYTDSIQTFANSGWNELVKEAGVEMNFTTQQDIGTYKGISLGGAIFTLKATNPQDPSAQMLNAMYGDGLKYRWVAADNLFLSAVGNSCETLVRELIDRAQSTAAPAAPAEFQTALSHIPGGEYADLAGTFNVLRGIKLIGSAMPQVGPMAMFGAMFESVPIETEASAAFALRVENNAASATIALPKEHLTEIVTWVNTMKQQMQPQQTPTAPQQPPSPG